MGAGSKICASQQWNNFLLFAMLGQRMGMWSFVASSDGCRTVPVFSRAGKWELFPAPPLCKGLPSLNSTHVSSIPYYWKFLWQEGQFSVTKEVLEHEWISNSVAAPFGCFTCMFLDNLEDLLWVSVLPWQYLYARNQIWNKNFYCLCQIVWIYGLLNKIWVLGPVEIFDFT